jgi:hypothetical protein
MQSIPIHFNGICHATPRIAPHPISSISFQPHFISTPFDSTPGSDVLLDAFDWADSQCGVDKELTALSTQSYWVKKAQSEASTVANISIAMGVPLALDLSLDFANDWLVVDNAHGFLAANWPKVTPDLFDASARLSTWILSQNNLLTPYAKQLYGGRMIGDMLTQFDNIISGQANYTLVHWSAHDTTIISLLLALGVFDGVSPIYASHVAIELRESLTVSPASITKSVTESSSQSSSSSSSSSSRSSQVAYKAIPRAAYDVVFLYNDQPLNIPVPTCVQNRCAYDAIYAYFTNSYPKLPAGYSFAVFDDATMQTLCNTYR